MYTLFFFKWLAALKRGLGEEEWVLLYYKGNTRYYIYLVLEHELPKRVLLSPPNSLIDFFTSGNSGSSYTWLFHYTIGMCFLLFWTLFSNSYQYILENKMEGTLFNYYNSKVKSRPVGGLH